ncbi:C-type lectin lectoxin-Lei1-like isoform X2 [Saccostrea cucullata]|uniref:C-type lectin lectoxin-Lei1-like isoform X2 n=1 Tax=Saccostrea cuccullata TaxID=36930 RepID=UPI002ED1EB70
MDSIKHCIAGLVIAFVFGAAYIFEERLSDIYKEVKKRNEELSIIRLTNKHLKTKVDTLEEFSEATGNKEFVTEKKTIENLSKRVEVVEKSLDNVEKRIQIYDKKEYDFHVTNCEKSWVKFEENCYLFISMNKNFTDAMDFCNKAAAGAQLLEIKSSHVEKWIDLQLTIRGFQNAWIGLTDLLKENEYVSILTGRKKTCTNWYKNQPSNSGNVEYCAEKRALYSWNDKRCDARIPFVCELSP